MKLSAALIVRNEEEHLPRLLKSLQGKFDEIVVVDTGSTDRTIDIAEEFCCKVYEKEWNGFADARNYAISKCSGDWIWHFDADFELEEEEYTKFLQIVRKLQNSDVEALTINVKNYNNAGIVSGVSSQTFIHRNLEYIRWHGNIHETLHVSQAPLVPIYVNHYGYQDAQTSYEKALRNLALIRKDLEKAYEKGDKYEILIKLFYLFQSYAVIAHHKGNIEDNWATFIDEFLAVRKSNDNDKNLYFFAHYTLLYIANIYYLLQKYEKALYFLDKALNDRFIHPDILYLKTKILHTMSKKREASTTFLACLKSLEKFESYKDSSGVVDNMENIWKFLLDAVPNRIFYQEDYIKIYEFWKQSRSIYFGILLLEIAKQYDSTNYIKLRRKMERLYQKNERALVYFLLNPINEQNSITLAKTIVTLNSKNVYANKVLALHYYKNNTFDRALHYFSNITTQNSLLEILPQFIDTLKQCGYANEAQKLLDLLKK